MVDCPRVVDCCSAPSPAGRPFGYRACVHAEAGGNERGHSGAVDHVEAKVRLTGFHPQICSERSREGKLAYVVWRKWSVG